MIVKWIDDDTESGLIPASMVSTLKVRSYPGSARVGFANLSCRGMHVHAAAVHAAAVFTCMPRQCSL